MITGTKGLRITRPKIKAGSEFEEECLQVGMTKKNLSFFLK